MSKSLKFLAAAAILFLLSATSLYAKSMEPRKAAFVEKGTNESCIQQRVHRVGHANLCLTNWGFLGSLSRNFEESQGGCFNPSPSQFLPAPSFEFPKGSGLEYLFQGAVWIGGVVEGETLVSVGTDGWFTDINELLPDEVPDGCIEEKSTLANTPNCNPPDQVGAVSEQDILAEYTDTLIFGVNPDPYDNRPHKPLGIKVIQSSYSWGKTGFDRFFILDYRIINIGLHNIDSAYVGFYYDGDVMHISNASGYTDDITGFKPNYVSPANETTEVDLAWLADNNGDPDSGAWTSHSVTGVTALRVLETPNPALKYSYNWWVSEGNDPVNLDWGPQKLANWDLWSSNYGMWCDGGKGTPCGDRAKYFVMSNGEIDYDQIYSCIDKTAEGWLPPSSICQDLADGYDARYLLSFGPFQLPIQDTLHFVMALIADDSFHTHPNNPIDPSAPDSFYSRLNFTGLAQTALKAESLYRGGYYTAVDDENSSTDNLPNGFQLFQNFPNPFNPNTVIEYALPQASYVKLVIYNLLGQRVRVLVNEHQNAGYKRISWDGRSDQGQVVKSGIYFYQLKLDENVLSRKMVLVK